MSQQTIPKWFPCLNCIYYQDGNPCGNCHEYLGFSVFECPDCINAMKIAEIAPYTSTSCQNKIKALTVFPKQNKNTINKKNPNNNSN